MGSDTTEDGRATGDGKRTPRSFARAVGRAGRPKPDGQVDQRGRRPAVPEEVTHLGPVMDGRVRQAHERVRLGVDPQYDLVYANFDMLHYLLQSPNAVERPGLDLVDHFLRLGSELHKSPHPDFSMDVYLSRHPELQDGTGGTPYVDWLTRGRHEGEIGDPAAGVVELAPLLGLEPQTVVELVKERRGDLRDRLLHGTLGEMFAKAVELEPLVGGAWAEITRPRMIPFTRPDVVTGVAELFAAQEELGFRRARVVFVINRPRWGGGRRMEGHLAHALVPDLEPEDIVVIYTDAEGTRNSDRFPAGVREVDLTGLAARLEPDRAGLVLVTLLRSLQADAILNINSRMLYHAMRDYGRALTATERIFPVLFCNEQTAVGTWQGWSLRYFYRLFDRVAGVITDSNQLAEDLRHTYRLTPAAAKRLHVFSAPVDDRLQLVEPSSRPHGRRRQVFWAGRWDRQKRVDLLLDIASALPEVDFRMWGEAVLGRSSRRLPPNVHPEGRYENFSDLPLADADLWLYTSAWDGVPSLLLEVAMTGIPIVGSLVGGTGEVLEESTAWPVDGTAGADAYVACIREVMADPIAARRRAVNLRERLLEARTSDGFAQHVTDVLLRPEGRSGGQP